jgi:hypothetical protein
LTGCADLRGIGHALCLSKGQSRGAACDGLLRGEAELESTGESGAVGSILQTRPIA